MKNFVYHTQMSLPNDAVVVSREVIDSQIVKMFEDKGLNANTLLMTENCVFCINPNNPEEYPYDRIQADSYWE